MTILWQLSSNPQWEAVSFPAMKEFQDKMIFSGGWIPQTNTFSNQNWVFDQNSGWISSKTNQIWSPRNGHALISHNNRLYLLGGFNYESKYLNDIWSSKNGIDWELEVQSAEWSGREGHQLVSFKGKFWILGGVGENGPLNDVWVSQNCVDWECVSETSLWEKRCFHNVEEFQSKLWLMGGDNTNQLFSSKDGATWELFSTPNPWKSRLGAGSFVFQNKLWILGGSTSNEKEYFNAIWLFDEELNWHHYESSVPWSPRWCYNSTLIFQDKIWVCCGGSRNREGKMMAFSDVWTL